MFNGELIPNNKKKRISMIFFHNSFYRRRSILFISQLLVPIYTNLAIHKEYIKVFNSRNECMPHYNSDQ